MLRSGGEREEHPTTPPTEISRVLEDPGNRAVAFFPGLKGVGVAGTGLFFSGHGVTSHELTSIHDVKSKGEESAAVG